MTHNNDSNFLTVHFFDTTFLLVGFILPTRILPSRKNQLKTHNKGSMDQNQGSLDPENQASKSRTEVGPIIFLKIQKKTVRKFLALVRSEIFKPHFLGPRIPGFGLLIPNLGFSNGFSSVVKLVFEQALKKETRFLLSPVPCFSSQAGIYRPSDRNLFCPGPWIRNFGYFRDDLYKFKNALSDM